MSNGSATRFTMLGTDDAQACVGDSCLVPVVTKQPHAEASGADDDVDIEPDPAEAAAASTRAITAALDEGASL